MDTVYGRDDMDARFAVTKPDHLSLVATKTNLVMLWEEG